MASSLGPREPLSMDSFGLIERGERERLGAGVTGGLGTHLAPGWTVIACQVEQVRPPWNVAPASGSATAGNSQEVVGQYGRAHQNLETLAAFGPAALHPPAAKQHRDATLDAHPKTLPLFERPAALQGFLLRRLLSAALGDAYLAHAGLLTVVHIVGTVKAPIAGVHFGRMLEDLLMTV